MSKFARRQMTRAERKEKRKDDAALAKGARRRRIRELAAIAAEGKERTRLAQRIAAANRGMKIRWSPAGPGTCSACPFGEGSTDKLYSGTGPAEGEKHDRLCLKHASEAEWRARGVEPPKPAETATPAAAPAALSFEGIPTTTDDQFTVGGLPVSPSDPAPTGTGNP